jgi:hypothetical protein
VQTVALLVLGEVAHDEGMFGHALAHYQQRVLGGWPHSLSEVFTLELPDRHAEGATAIDAAEADIRIRGMPPKCIW